jgi:hypothetical protein
VPHARSIGVNLPRLAGGIAARATDFHGRPPPIALEVDAARRSE